MTLVERVIERRLAAGWPAALAHSFVNPAIPPDDLELPRLAPPARVGDWARPGAILLTGATGFVGIHTLCDLLRRTDADIHCLVRCRSEAEGKERLLEMLGRYRLPTPPGFDRRVRLVEPPGDLAKPRFGLSPASYERLAEEIDLVVHIGARVNHVLPYSLLREPNVLGTRSVIELAATGKNKAIHAVTTLVVFASRFLNPEDLITEDDESLAGVDVDIGYAQSKWASEQLLAAARRQGLTVSIYRCGAMVGDQVHGIPNGGDLYAFLLSTFLATGVAPDITPLPSAPVDFTAAGLGALVTDPSTFGRTYHLHNPHPHTAQTYAKELTEAGYPLALLPYPMWKSLVVKLGGIEGHPFAPIKYVAAHDPPWMTGQMPIFASARTREALAPHGVTCPPLDRKLLAHYAEALLAPGSIAAQVLGRRLRR